MSIIHNRMGRPLSTNAKGMNDALLYCPACRKITEFAGNPEPSWHYRCKVCGKTRLVSNSYGLGGGKRQREGNAFKKCLKSTKNIWW